MCYYLNVQLQGRRVNPLFLFLFNAYERKNHMFCDLKNDYLNENKALFAI